MALRDLRDVPGECEAQVIVRRVDGGWEAVCMIDGEEWAKVWSKDRGRAVVEISHYVSQL